MSHSPVLVDESLLGTETNLVVGRNPGNSAESAHGALFYPPKDVVEGFPSPLSENLLTSCIRKVPSETRAKELLRRRGVPKLEDLEGKSVEDKIAALAYLQYAYNPPLAAARFTQKVLASVRASLLLRNPEDRRYWQFLYQQGQVLRGGRPIAMPQFLRSLQGAGFILAGPSGVGKTALVQRLRALIGQEPVLVNWGGDAPAQMTFIPMVVVKWPECGTLAGLLANFRQVLISEIGPSVATDYHFSNFMGSNGTNAAISAALLLNLGLFVLDGGCIRSLRGEFRDILGFISTLQRNSGIPTLITCTYPVLQAIARSGGAGANTASAHAEFLDLLPPGPLWASYCKFFWNLGLAEPCIPMPGYIPSLMWKFSRGDMGIMSQGFSGLHHALLDHPQLLAGEALKETDASDIVCMRLRMYEETVKVLELFQTNRAVPLEDLWAHGDYLPYEAFNETPSRDFERRLSRRKSPVSSILTHAE
ncbi:hypothetical protein [Noviherbaspirillum denitrificans]|uniref:AAA+ ATPase domain-containing protein n=1 Tax=Noviherbaspirillum denitrificans TaxID=1968433 RepID=A0A254TF30_9BURK|nr:hypothetical protein [Noviherbaspirillum denitrificans]OWW20767.1 hypothetical protein AYR66_16090 [Noviherbaspirillum denitrificans]